MGLISLKNAKERLEFGGTEARKKIKSLYEDINFLSGLTEDVKTPEDAMNFFHCLSNIHKKVSDVIHLIQYFSIISRANSTSRGTNIAINIGPMQILLPFYRKPRMRQIINSSLEDLNHILSKCNSLQGKIELTLKQINLIKDNDEKESSNSGNFSSIPPDPTSDQMALILAMTTLERISEDNQDSTHILRNVIEWDDEKDWTLGKSGSRIRFRWIKAPSNEITTANVDNSNNDYNVLWNRSKKINSQSTSQSCPSRYFCKLRVLIVIGILLSLIAITVIFKVA